MFTSRGYRQAKRENRNKSRQGQIIQQKPVFQIDNNPVVLEAYRQFLFGTMPSKMLIPTKMLNTFDCTLANYGLTWNGHEIHLDTIQNGLITFAGTIFDQMDTLGKHCLSLELYSPNLSDSNGWVQMNPAYPLKFVARFSRIIIDRNGTLSYVQNGANAEYTLWSSNLGYDVTELTLGYGPYSVNDSFTYSNPTKMKVDINYYPIWRSN